MESVAGESVNTPDPQGYADEKIANLVIRKTEALIGRRIEDVVAGEALLPTLLAVACSGDRVLDFGGGAGFHYLAASQAFPWRPFCWAVVEHPMMIARVSHLEHEKLRFFSSPDKAVDWLGAVDLLHSNGVLQYLDAPEEMLTRLIAFRPAWASWSRLPVGMQRAIEMQVAPLSAHGPGPCPPGIVDREITHRTVSLERSAFIAAHIEYRLVWQSADSFLFAR